MADQTDVDDLTVEDEPSEWMEPPLQKRSIFAGVNWGRAVLRFVAIVFVACGIGYAIAYVTNSRTFQALSTESRLNLAPGSSPVSSPKKNGHGPRSMKEP